MANYNYKDGVIRDGHIAGQGLPLGNLKRGVIRDGAKRGFGSVLGSYRDGLIFEGGAPGRGRVVLNVDEKGAVRDGPVKGMGKRVYLRGRRKIAGEQLDWISAVAIQHFLVKKLV